MRVVFFFAPVEVSATPRTKPEPWRRTWMFPVVGARGGYSEDLQLGRRSAVGVAGIGDTWIREPGIRCTGVDVRVLRSDIAGVP